MSPKSESVSKLIENTIGYKLSINCFYYHITIKQVSRKSSFEFHQEGKKKKGKEKETLQMKIEVARISLNQITENIRSTFF